MNNTISLDIGYIKKDMGLTININTIKKLLEEGYDINSHCINGHTPIHYHAIAGNFDIVKFLLDNGADPLIKNIYQDHNALTGSLYYKQNEIHEYIKQFNAHKFI
jgi:ankyrin repeat protein